MADVTAVARTGNWVHHVITCQCGRCPGTWDLGICDYQHPNRLRMWWWRLYGKPKAARRIKAWNAHVVEQETHRG